MVHQVVSHSKQFLNPAFLMSKKIKPFDISENPSQSLNRKPELRLLWLITVSWNENIKSLGTLK